MHHLFPIESEENVVPCEQFGIELRHIVVQAPVSDGKPRAGIDGIVVEPARIGEVRQPLHAVRHIDVCLEAKAFICLREVRIMLRGQQKGVRHRVVFLAVTGDGLHRFQPRFTQIAAVRAQRHTVMVKAQNAAGVVQFGKAGLAEFLHIFRICEPDILAVLRKKGSRVQVDVIVNVRIIFIVILGEQAEPFIGVLPRFVHITEPAQPLVIGIGIQPVLVHFFNGRCDL